MNFLPKITEAIEDLSITKQQKDLIKLTWLNEISELSKTIKTRKSICTFTKGYVVIAGVLTSVLIGYSNPNAKVKWEAIVGYTAMATSVTLSIVSGLEKANRLPEKLKEDEKAYLLLLQEGVKYLAQSEDYNNQQNSFGQFIKTINDISREHKLNKLMLEDEITQEIYLANKTNQNKFAANLREMHIHKAQENTFASASIPEKTTNKEKEMEKYVKPNDTPKPPPRVYLTSSGKLSYSPTDQVKNIPEILPPPPPPETIQEPTSRSTKLFTPEMLKQIMPNASQENIDKFCDPINRVCEEENINTPLRRAMFIAQIAHETASLKWQQELGGPSYFKRYENRRDLGNINPGDGARYHGRGLFQLTGRYNYKKCGDDLGLDLVGNPDQVFEDPYVNAKVTAWYWKTRNLNKPSDADDIVAATKIVNGGTNGLSDRKAFYKRAKQVLGA